MLILGLSGLCALHVFMLAGHGSGHSPAVGLQGSAEHAASSPSPRSTPMPNDERRAAIDMAVACLAVLAGLVLLTPRRTAEAATASAGGLAASRDPARLERAGPRTRSLAELCISLT
jgi:hypothetical protein